MSKLTDSLNRIQSLEELAEGTLRMTHIDKLTEQQWRYHNDIDVPTYADCHRLDDTLLTP